MAKKIRTNFKKEYKLFKACEKSDMFRPAMEMVHFMNNCAYMSDAHILAKVPLYSCMAVSEEQKPAEWSEEDEKNIEKLDGFLSEVFCYGHVYVSQKDKEELQNWLKSLRPQPHWKPSAEQMRAVFDASERNDKLGSVLLNLYNDLKKL